MRAPRPLLVALAAALALTAASCGATAPPLAVSAQNFDPGNFDRSSTVDNEWFPLEPGAQLTFEGATNEDGERIAHRLVSTVTDLTKTVNGVRVAVVWERDWSRGTLAEAELAFFAQDEQGTVWNLGEYPEVYEHGKIVEVPGWIAGTKGARAGIAMKAEPKLGAPAYSQGYAPPPVNWVDRAEVYKTGVTTCVPAGCFGDVLMTREFEMGKPAAYQLKYYARGVGNIRVGWLGRNDKDHEVLRLVRRAQLTPRALATARAAALRMEKRAYRIRKAVYGATTPAERIR
jgi:hypothetical protein